MTRDRQDSGQDNPEIRYVGFWARFGAFFVDSIVASLLMMPLMNSSSDLATLNSSDPALLDAYLQELFGPQTIMEILIIAVIIIAFWIYYAATPGKMLFRGYIVNAKDFRKVSTKQLVIRYIGYYVSLLVFGLGFLWIGIDKRKQGLHDKMAGTVVINQKPVA
jgi:uncharacterized RDD family membrane protein YckC